MQHQQQQTAAQFGFIHIKALLILTSYIAVCQSTPTTTDIATNNGLVAVVPCMENGRFYRNPDRPGHKQWTSQECAKYFLCVEGDVFPFHCSAGLLFDVVRQICDVKLNVDNCDITAVPPPPAATAGDMATASHFGSSGSCSNRGQFQCADHTCIPADYFCDGNDDCGDSSDEYECNEVNSSADWRHPGGAATPCNVDTCQLPRCFCSTNGTDIPGGLDARQTPQMVLLTFDDAINADNFAKIRDVILDGSRRNPNGCPITATFFISHQYNNYHHTRNLWAAGHEIAIHSITHRGPESWWSYNATLEDWFDEMVGQANMLHHFAQIPLGQMRGLRTPFLRLGWHRQFLMMHEFGFQYDASVIAPPIVHPPLWPYTLDHRMPHRCHNIGGNCPQRSYAGLWVIPINQLQVTDGRDSAHTRSACVNLETCPPPPTAVPPTHQAAHVYSILMGNFRRHYQSNRAPFGLHLHAQWLKDHTHLNGVVQFVDEIIANYPDVWFVSHKQAIEWMQEPRLLSKLGGFKPWQIACKVEVKDQHHVCRQPNACKLYSRIFQQERYLYTCAPCPKVYPWIRNEFGSK